MDLVQRTGLRLEERRFRRRFSARKSAARRVASHVDRPVGVVVLDEEGVRQAETVVRASAAAHGVALEDAQAGGRFPRREGPPSVPRRASTYSRVRVATPDSRWTRFSAVRSAASTVIAGPSTSARTAPGFTLSRPPRGAARPRAGTGTRTGVAAARRPRRPPARGTPFSRAMCAAGTEDRERRDVLALFREGACQHIVERRGEVSRKLHLRIRVGGGEREGERVEGGEGGGEGGEGERKEEKGKGGGGEGGGRGGRGEVEREGREGRRGGGVYRTLRSDSLIRGIIVRLRGHFPRRNF